MQTTMNSTTKFNTIVVVKALKSVLCSSHDGIVLKFSKKKWRQFTVAQQ
jgi:hypothetical protein